MHREYLKKRKKSGKKPELAHLLPVVTQAGAKLRIVDCIIHRQKSPY
jgi:hypothetical protein